MALLTPENLPQVLIGIGAIITAVGGITWWRIQREPPKPGSPDAAAVALAENTRAMLAMVDAMKVMVDAMKAQNTHFAENNEMFHSMGQKVEGMARDFADIKHDTSESKGHLAAMRDALNRRR